MPEGHGKASANSAAARRLSASLDLSFRGGPVSTSSTPSWRDGKWSDWSVIIGTQKYNLHAFTLARASQFFESHMNVATQTGSLIRESDLTQVLPEACYDVFEDMLDFVYSDNQASFQILPSKALLLLKTADILGVPKLFEASKSRVQEDLEDSAPVILEQFCSFHIPGTNDSEMLRCVQEHSVTLITERFEWYMAQDMCKEALVRLPPGVLLDIVSSDDLAVACEDTVFDFVLSHMELCSDADSWSEQAARKDSAALWDTVRWAHLSIMKFAEVGQVDSRLLPPNVLSSAYASRIEQREISVDCAGQERLDRALTQRRMKRRTVRPPDIPLPASTDIDFCIFFGHAERFRLGQALRSDPLQIGDLVVRVLVFPCGTNTGVAHGSLSIFLEAVPQPHWPPDWEFTQIRYSMVCYRWPVQNGDRRTEKKKVDTWTFRASKLDRGWHDFLQANEVQKYLSPYGFLLFRGSIDVSCLARTFLTTSEPSAVTNEASEIPSPEGTPVGRTT